MPEAHDPGDRTPAQREADHASLARLSDTLVPALVQKLAASGLGELEVREGDWRIRLRRPPGSGPGGGHPSRRGDRVRGPGTPAGGHGPEREPARSPREPHLLAEAAAVADADDRRSIATSPAVGVFRPGAAPGTRLRAGDRIAIVDLLGIPQDVVAPIDGTLAEVFVQAGDAVEYGEAIAAIEPAAADEPGAAGEA
jgi:biotin carboxyl carrier protein